MSFTIFMWYLIIGGFMFAIFGFHTLTKTNWQKTIEQKGKPRAIVALVLYLLLIVLGWLPMFLIGCVCRFLGVKPSTITKYAKRIRIN